LSSPLRGAPRPAGRGASYPWTALAIVGLIAAAIRLFVGFRYNLLPAGDTIRGYQFYLDLARHTVEGNGYFWNLYGPKFANRPPAYPMLLAGTLALGAYPWGVLVVQSLIGGVVAMLAGGLACGLGSARAAVVAAVIVAGYPYFILADTSLIEHGLFTLVILLVALAWLSLSRSGSSWAALRLGLLMGAAVLVRVTFTASIPVVLLAVLVGVVRGRKVRSAVLALAAAAAVVSPWVARNTAVVGRPTLSTDTWRALWVAHNDLTLELYPANSIDLVERRSWKRMRKLDPAHRARILALSDDEVAQSAVFRELALGWIRENPKRVLRGILVKAGAFFSPIMNPPSDPPEWKNVAYTVSYCAVALAGLAAFLVLRRQWREWLIVPALFLGFLGSAVLTWGQTRYRAPLDALLIALAAVLVDRWWGGRRNLAGEGEKN